MRLAELDVLLIGIFCEIRILNPDRLKQLDGLRGFAALSVVLFHFMSAFAPYLVAEQTTDAVWVSYSPFAALWNGPFAVSIFFVLSGFVLTNATVRRPDPLWINILIRYLRLAVPALLSSCFGWMLLNIFPLQASELYQVTHSRWLLWTYQDGIPNFYSAIYSGAVDVFLTGGSYFNNVLWTMRPEFLGSILCFIICLSKGSMNRIVVSSILFFTVFFLGKYEYASFIIGAWLREFWNARRTVSNFSIAALIIGLLIGSQSGDAGPLLGLGWLPKFLAVGTKNSMLYPTGAGLIVFSCITSTTVARVLSGKTGTILGSISFPLYLIHVPMIYTLFSFVYLTDFDYKFARPIVFLTLIVMMFLFAYAIEISVERPLLKRLSNFRLLLNRMNPCIFRKSKGTD